MLPAYGSMASVSTFNPFGPGADPGQPRPEPGAYPGGYQPPAGGGQPWTPTNDPNPVQSPAPNQPRFGRPVDAPGRHEAPASGGGRHEAGQVFDTGLATAGYERQDPLARPGAEASGAGALTLATPPNGLLIVAGGVAAIGAVVGAVGWGQWWALLGWLLAGPIAIWLIARFIAVDTLRKTATVYSRPSSTGVLWTVALAVVVIAIAVTALAVGFWIGRL